MRISVQYFYIAHLGVYHLLKTLPDTRATKVALLHTFKITTITQE